MILVKQQPQGTQALMVQYEGDQVLSKPAKDVTVRRPLTSRLRQCRACGPSSAQVGGDRVGTQPGKVEPRYCTSVRAVVKPWRS